MVNKNENSDLWSYKELWILHFIITLFQAFCYHLQSADEETTTERFNVQGHQIRSGANIWTWTILMSHQLLHSTTKPYGNTFQNTVAEDYNYSYTDEIQKIIIMFSKSLYWVRFHLH